jgi:hypothetical protein
MSRDGTLAGSGSRRCRGSWCLPRRRGAAVHGRVDRVGDLEEAGIDAALKRAASTWADFLRSQADALLAYDFLETVTLTGTRMYVFAMIEHASRRIRILGGTTQPTASWVTQAAKNLVMDLRDTCGVPKTPSPWLTWTDAARSAMPSAIIVTRVATPALPGVLPHRRLACSSPGPARPKM